MVYMETWRHGDDSHIPHRFIHCLSFLVVRSERDKKRKEKKGARNLDTSKIPYIIILIPVSKILTLTRVLVCTSIK